MHQHPPARGPHGAGQVHPPRLGLAQAIAKCGCDGKEDDQHRHHHLGRHAESEPQHQQRRERENRHGLAEQHHRHDPPPQRRPQRHADGKHAACPDADAKAKQRFLQRGHGRGFKLGTARPQGARHGIGRGQHVGRHMPPPRQRAPQSHQPGTGQHRTQHRHDTVGGRSDHDTLLRRQHDCAGSTDASEPRHRTFTAWGEMHPVIARAPLPKRKYAIS
ncbi:hypothetical protein KOXY103107_12100 [Komagataeibacter xylinus]